MPNPTGINNFNRFPVPSRPAGAYVPEDAYGEKKRQGDLERLAPIPKERARKRGGQRQQAAPVEATPAASPSQVSPQMIVAQTWAEVAADPGASEFVRALALTARG